MSRLRALPAVAKLLVREDVAAWAARHPRVDVTSALRRSLDEARDAVKGGAPAPSDDRIAARAGEILAASSRAGLRRVVNATGVILHTGLGRAVLPQAAMDALAAEAGGYCLLALDDETNERGRRERFCESILRDLTGCEAATIVNNNAAACMLVLNTMAAGREVIVSRGQLVEIGGAFRMPDVMARSGCRMVEVGCTNKTHLADYRRAIGPDTAAILRVHPSNYRVVGFQSEPSIAELVALGREHGIPVIDDLGSGALVKLGVTFDEPLVSESLEAGAAVVTCSADKLIGGPQGGIILGRKDVVAACDDNQLARALRVGKLDLIALEATLRLFKDPEKLLRDHPTARMLAEPKASVAKRAEALAAAIRAAVPSASPAVVDADAYAGSGALPIRTIPSKAVAVDPPRGASATDCARRLRTGDPSLFVRIDEDRLVLDPRTLQPGEEAQAVAALAALWLTG
ncbi:MAG: L-seryl-tRNA(Sec) selenium transferase [Planctomycetes bacterium]|nr:L-seryl-tRNA(Sec) selenium transferase [Planctomycetota bacterium]